MTKKPIIIGVLLLIFISSIFAQGALIERYLSAANDNLTKREYKKAFDYINYVLSQYPESQVPQNVELLAENVYYEYLVEIRDTRDMESFSTVKDKLLEYEFLSSERVSRIIKVINTIESQDAAWGSSTPAMPKSGTAAAAVAARSAEREAELKKQIEALNNELAVLEKVLQMAREDKEKDAERALIAEQHRLESVKEGFENALKASSKSVQINSKLLFIIIGATVGLVIIILIIVLIVSSSNMRNVQKQQEQFEATMEMVARITSGGALGIGDGSEMRSAGSSKLGSVALPQPDMDESERLIMRDLALKCEALGSEVDARTGRKNNSKNVAETVFKICQQLGLDSLESSVYFCAAMVYDSGFLLVDQQLLTATGKLSEEEKKQIRDHVNKGLDELEFVPQEYKTIFENAVLMHHENMDGSGYPSGLSGEQIPLVARIIHVAETFVALISRRNYHGISDKESAVEELKARPNLYDSKIVSALDEVL